MKLGEQIFYYEFPLTVALLIAYIATRMALRRVIKVRAHKFGFHPNRELYMKRFFDLMLSGLGISILTIIWDITFEGIAIYFTSFFAIAGVAFFANWSVLSNITASAVIYFYYPHKIGSRIKIVDGDNSIAGVVTDHTIFTIRIKTDEGQLVSYPNNLIVQKPIMQLD